ncbi:OmpA family protein [Algoriphagus aestuariicola]|uniref:OmpA family protein n=1 Tax=Algoriphagus aestuariicola TaxID=1852016 RepID=A0ABS3BR50_9BACT|nr:OmpA family protein [Algoriphagus aestuariicola]MBN7801760.1 OmpA family protein [Algoriphagus aestuariicola]
MKKLILFLLLIGATMNVFAQNDFNKWSLEVNGGFNKPMAPLTPGYLSPTLKLGHTDFGARYMFNQYFGLSGNFGVGNFSELKGESLEFSTTYLSTSFRGVMNIGRLLSFESFSQKFTMLADLGFGFGALKPETRIIPSDEPDYVYSINTSVKVLYLISERISLQGTVSTNVNGRQRYTFDGNEFNQEGRPDVPEIPFVHATGTWWTGTIGLNFYLGKADQHADWHIAAEKYATKDELAESIAGINEMLKDSDGDGVADYLDKEPNTQAGARVSPSGVSMDSDSDGTPDHLDQCPFLPGPSSTKGCPIEEIKDQSDYLKKAIDEGYVNLYFGFDSHKPLDYSTSSASFVANFLQKNPSLNLEVEGYADELGEEDYNMQLSEKRAKAVYDLLVAAGVQASRLTYKGYGEDSSLDKSSPEARQMARRASFAIK